MGRNCLAFFIFELWHEVHSSNPILWCIVIDKKAFRTFGDKFGQGLISMDFSQNIFLYFIAYFWNYSRFQEVRDICKGHEFEEPFFFFGIPSMIVGREDSVVAAKFMTKDDR